ncbi:MAG: spiro-SPASM protein [Treponema sp.]|jgi:spiro-SPASM protein|nr:spiro-SPASM protein [Treponema sp.]
MKALAALYGGSLSPEAFSPSFSGKTALAMALERAACFPGVSALVLLGTEGEAYPDLPAGATLVSRPAWTKKLHLQTLSELSEGYDLTYFAWADCPLLDPVLAGRVAERHLRYVAEYSYADGWPYGLAPELLSPGTAGILAKILGDDDGPVERDALFSAIQKDINAFDIETEISPVDLRSHRLALAADSRRNLLLLSGLREAGLSAADDADRIIAGRPDLLRTLPAFYPIQVAGPCPQACSFCPYPQFGTGAGGVTGRKDFLDPGLFAALLDRIVEFSGDGVIDLSLWGELALHPQKSELAAAILDRPELSALVETSGLGWTTAEMEGLAERACRSLPGKNHLPRLSWIVSLDAADSGRYREIRGSGFTEAAECARTLTRLFPGNAYVQALRVKGAEDDIEQFYRSWQEAEAKVIIQKYDDFCGALPKLQAADLSPVRRHPCWHLMRDMPILIDGRVPLCRETLFDGEMLGNVFTEDLAIIWARGAAFYRDHCGKLYQGLCAECDEYYTYNF